MFPTQSKNIKLTMLLSLSIILLVSIGLRIGITYLKADRHLTVPDFYFARDLVGRDFESGVMNIALDILSGRYETRETYYGPAFAVALAGTFPIAELTSPCKILTNISCITQYYRLMVFISILLLAIFTLIISRDTFSKIIGFVTISIFLIGIPGARGLETGNIDIFLAPVFGFTLLLFMNTQNHPNPKLGRYILLGILFGWLANTKIFLFPYAFVAIIFARQKLPIISGFAVSFIGNSIVPLLFGAHNSIADPFISSKNAIAIFSKHLFINSPGNNAITTISSLPADLLIHSDTPMKLIITAGVTIFCSFFVFIVPFYKTPYRIRSLSVLSWIAVCTVAITLFPPVSFDYRLYFYLVFLLYSAGSIRKKEPLAHVYMAILLLLIKSLWIEHARLLNIFLLLSCYYCIRGTVLIKSEKQALSQRY